MGFENEFISKELNRLERALRKVAKADYVVIKASLWLFQGAFIEMGIEATVGHDCHNTFFIDVKPLIESHFAKIEAEANKIKYRALLNVRCWSA
jgi:hypothetical protein